MGEKCYGSTFVSKTNRWGSIPYSPRHFFYCVDRPRPAEYNTQASRIVEGCFFCPQLNKKQKVMFDQFIRFCQEAYQELKLSSWLTRQQMMGSTVVVTVLTLIVAAYVAVS